jgi:hypothetical protein
MRILFSILKLNKFFIIYSYIKLYNNLNKSFTPTYKLIMLTEKKTNYRIKKIIALFTLHMLNLSISIIRIFYFKIYKRK